MCGACETAATLPASQGAAVPCATPTSAATSATTTVAASASGGGSCPCARPVRQSTAALVCTQAHLQLEALSACGTGEGPASRGRGWVLLLPRLMTKAFCPARVFAGIIEGSWGLAGVQDGISIVRRGEGESLGYRPWVQAHRRFTPEIPAPPDATEEPIPGRGLLLCYGRTQLTNVPLWPSGLPQPQHRVLAGEGTALAFPGSFLDRAGKESCGLAWCKQSPMSLQVGGMHRCGYHFLFLDFCFDNNFYVCWKREKQRSFWTLLKATKGQPHGATQLKGAFRPGSEASPKLHLACHFPTVKATPRFCPQILFSLSSAVKINHEFILRKGF